MKCPVCIKEGKTSTITDLGGMTTLAGHVPYYDEEGVRHYHDGNRQTHALVCSNGHEWTEHRYHKCANCDWTGGETKVILRNDYHQIYRDVKEKKNERCEDN